VEEGLMDKGRNLQSVVGCVGLSAAGNIRFPKGVINGAPVFETLRVKVRSTWNNGNPRGFLDENDISSGELKKGRECNVTPSNIDGVDDEVV